MGWHGFFAFGGSEIINAERVEKYLDGVRASWFRPHFNTTAISTLSDETYENSWVDQPPWADPDDPDTYRFYGVYPLNVTGLEDSTRTANVTENVYDGAWIGNLRHASRSIVFEVMLTGANECAVEAGFRWLKQALLTDSTCADGGCDDGVDLCYFSCEPCLPAGCGDTDTEREACVSEFRRTLRNVKVVTGPTVSAQRTLSDGSSMWTATFTATAGIPFEFGSEVPLVSQFNVASNPWVPTIVPADWRFSTAGSTVVDKNCSMVEYDPIVDPLCPAIEVPPDVPDVPLGCYVPPDAWQRRWFTIPRKYIPYWGDVVPVVEIEARADAVRNLRLRFYADFNADASVLDDPCAYCGDILFSYIPPNTSITFDGASERVWATSPGGVRRRADTLVYKTDGTPFDWPLLTCGYGYVVALDVPSDHTGMLPSVDLALVSRSA